MFQYFIYRKQKNVVSPRLIKAALDLPDKSRISVNRKESVIKIAAAVYINLVLKF